LTKQANSNKMFISKNYRIFAIKFI